MALIRFLQFSIMSFDIRSTPWDPITANSWASLPGLSVHLLVPSQPGSSLHPGIVWSFGEPTRSKIICAWFKSVLPIKIGDLLNISPKTHPIPHMSTAGVYLRSCRRSSGGLYQRVTTSEV